MLSPEARAQFAYTGLDIAVVEARLAEAAGTQVVVVGSAAAFMGTALIVKVTATGRTFLLDSPDDDTAWPRPSLVFRSRKAVPVADLAHYRARRR